MVGVVCMPLLIMDTYLNCLMVKLATLQLLRINILIRV